MKLTLKDIEKAKDRYLKAFKEYETMRAIDVGFDNQCKKVNRLNRQYKKVKGSFFFGNN